MKKHVLEVDGIQKRFDQKVVLSDVYLKCETDEIIGLLGRNGSGKSTLLKVIYGLVSAPNKCIRINAVSKNNGGVLLSELSYLDQEQFIPAHLSVKRVISLSIAPDYLDVFYQDSWIKAIEKKKISHLSGGELRYLEIRLVLYNSSKFVLLDEPYNGLSPLMIEEVNQMIKENSQQKGIIITDHNYQNVLEVATRLVLLKEGKTHPIKEKAELVEKGYLLAHML